jgi:hypothetical protein
MPLDRVFEYTDLSIKEKFTTDDGEINLKALSALPCLFLQETFGDRNRIVHVGTISRATITGKDILLEYSYDNHMQALTNGVLEDIAQQFGIYDMFEFSRTHWAVKEADLYQTLLRNVQPNRKQPKVFNISAQENIDSTLISAMMPFHPGFDKVYSQLQATAKSTGMQCKRADDIWENETIIQDIVSLIDRSAVVICDCTGRNSNVFYEIGIAHTLGRETILITQSESDVPFDLRHLRYLKYLNNDEGLKELAGSLKERITTLIQRKSA